MLEIFKDKKDCTGCTACEESCPVKAITMQPSETGHLYPAIDAEKCIGCGNCMQVHERRVSVAGIEEKQPVIAYGAKEKETNTASASGGIAGLLAADTVENRGVVYGAVFNSAFHVHHIRCAMSDSFSRLSGSKYVQSDLEDIFCYVRADLEAGIPVMFTGTPCQIEGLKAYLNKDYENLLTVDIVCHGVPSQRMFDDYLKTLTAHYSKWTEITGFTFRDKSSGWGIDGKITLTSYPQPCTDGDTFHKKLWASKEPYFYYFLNGSLYRESCYVCPFTSVHKRPADITLCDFWGIEKVNPDFNAENGVSGILCNTAKGAEAIARILDKCEWFETTPENIAAGNTQLRTPSVNSNPAVLKAYAEKGWDGVIEEYNKEPWLKRHSSQIKRLVPKKIKEKYKQARKD